MSSPGSSRPVPAPATEVELFSVAGADGLLREVNTPFAALLGVDPQALDGRSVLELVHPDDVPDVVAGLAALAAGASEILLENRFRKADGGWTHLQWVARPLDGTDLWWAAGRDTTPYHLLLAEGAGLRARLDLAVGQATAAMWELDHEGRLTWEPQAAALLDLAVDALPGTMAALAAAVGPRDAAAVAGAHESLLRSGRTDVELQVGDGPGARQLALRGKLLGRDRRGRPLRAVGLLVDLTSEKAMEQQLLRMVMSDALTGVPNRRAFDQTLRAAWRDCGRSGDPLSVVMVDIDDFKLFNDTFGHLIGDQALTLVSRTLGEHLASDCVTRFGGEEFALVLPHVDSGAALATAERLCDAVRGVTLRQAPGWGLSISAGVATWRPEDRALKSAQLVSRADQALYVAKREGKDRAVSFEAALAERAALESALRTGLAAGELELHYQPVVDARTGALATIEGLVRWQRPGHGTVPPADLLAVADRSDLGIELGRLALGQGCTQLAGWSRTGLDTGQDHGAATAVRVAVTLSGRHLADPGVVADVATALGASGLAADRLEVELAEDVLGRPRVREHLTSIRALGVSVSLGDFGTGHTALRDLSSLPVDALRLDPSFLTAPQPGQRDLVTLVVAAAHALGLRVVAGGVDDLRVLTGLSCDLVQGRAVAAPMPAAAVPGWLRRPRSPGSAA